MLQPMPFAGKGKLVSIEGVGLVRVDPRFPRSDSRSGWLRGQSASEPELELKKKKKKETGSYIEPNVV